MDKMIEFVCEQLEELEKKAAKGSLSVPEVQYADTLAHLKKNLLKSEEMMAEMEGGSFAGGSYAGGSNRGSYARGGRGGQGGGSNRGGSYRGGSYEGSYEGGGQGGSYEGSYARGGRGRGSNARRDSMGRYSSERGYSRDPEEMADQLRELMEQAPDESIRRDIERVLNKVEQQM